MAYAPRACHGATAPAALEYTWNRHQSKITLAFDSENMLEQAQSLLSILTALTRPR
ncbi:MAG: hypothetical protein ACAI35_06155 [Candidatus Methylacidiphilales bacterium]|nr:hypothetical protein [Candidatus Methylacidiphilales bacterium]